MLDHMNSEQFRVPLRLFKVREMAAIVKINDLGVRDAIMQRLRNGDAMGAIQAAPHHGARRVRHLHRRNGFTE